MILVFGQSGQVARELALLPDVRCLGRADVDLEYPLNCAEAIAIHRPAAVINAAAYTAVDAAEDDEARAHMINAAAPEAMAQACADLGIPFVSISTDYVFDGAGNTPWREGDMPAPINTYGRSKLAGEQAIAQAGGTWAVLRTSWVVSAHGNNFVKTMLRLGAERDALNIVADQIGGLTPARDIARACHHMAQSLISEPNKGGIYHFSGSPNASWADVARATFEAADLTCTVTDIPSTDYPTPATRPLNSRLDCYKIKKTFGLKRPDWRTGMTQAPHQRKGIILAGGSGTRLYPITMGVSKQLLPIYDKPMIYYPLSVMMLAGIREIAVITTPEDQDQFKRTLGDGTQWGLSLSYIIQPKPEGLAQAYILAEDFLNGAPSAMVLGDNIFFGHGLPKLLARADAGQGATVFGYHVADPERYGVLAFDGDKVTDIIEKPAKAPSNYAVTGLYFLDGSAPERARGVEPSERGELEITSLLGSYLKDGALNVETMGRGYAWLDTGTHASLLDAGNFVRTLTERQGLQSGCPEEIAYENQWIDADAVRARAKMFAKNSYGAYLLRMLEG